MFLQCGDGVAGRDEVDELFGGQLVAHLDPHYEAEQDGQSLPQTAVVSPA